MRLRRKTIIGKIDSKGKLAAPISVLEDFFSMHKGKGVIIRAEIMASEPSEKVRGFFFGYIIPELQGAMEQVYGERYSKGQTYDWLRKQCPLFYKEERVEGKWKVILKEFEELDASEANDVIEWTMQFASENFGLIINDAKGEY